MGGVDGVVAFDPLEPSRGQGGGDQIRQLGERR